VRFIRARPRTPYNVTDRKRAAARRWQKRQRDALPLLAALVAEQQPSIDQVMEDRERTWTRFEQSDRDQRARRWRSARRQLYSYDPATRRTLLDYWNGHRWLPADPSYLSDMLHGFQRGRLVIIDGVLQPARTSITIAELADTEPTWKPVALGWLNARS